MNKFAFVLSIFLSSFSFAQTRLNGENLLKEDAQYRSSLVSDVKYDLYFDLTSAKHFLGLVKISFQLKDVPQFLTVDFREGETQKLVLNGTTIDPGSHNGSLILLKAAELKKGANLLEVQYSHPYSKDGSGFYRFEDPEDKRSYLYTDFEPYDANRLFPCFDQPDLKATYTLSVLAPKDWTIVSSTRENKVEKSGKFKKWHFPESKRFSTYIFSLMAGPYKIWESRAGKIPLRLLARRSLAKYVKPEFWFQISQQGFDFFPKYFGVEYPFEKYDQIIVPDFNSGAMENVGAVTFSERFIKRGKETRSDRFGLANVILHEMSHMWFGNLVTMKWWGDLWLNETFATYMAYLAQSRATEFTEAWKSFASDDKAWAVFEDQMPTTHPVKAEVPDTQSALSNFDGITYAKGAAVMKQISFVMGEALFQQGLKDYFQSYSYQNASFEDFMSRLENAAGRSLGHISQDWLSTAGLNNVRTEWECKDAQLSELALIQSATLKEFPTLREHKTWLAFFKQSSTGAPELLHQESIVYRGSKTTIRLSKSIPCPDFVYPNFQDQDYVQVSLDPKSYAFLETNMASFKGNSEYDLLRNSLWQNVWDDANNARISLDAYLKIFYKALPEETEATTLETSLGNVEQILWWTPDHLSQTRSQEISDFLSKTMEKAAPASDKQALIYRTFAGTYFNSKQAKRLISDLNRSQPLKKMNWDQDLRWAALRSICSGQSSCASLITAEKKKDNSQNGKLGALGADAAQKDLSTKEKIYREITTSKSSFAELRASMRSFWQWNQKELMVPFKNKFFVDLLSLQEKQQDHFLRQFARRMLPLSCNEQDLKTLNEGLKAHGSKLKTEALKSLKISERMIQKCLESQKLGAR